MSESAAGAWACCRGGRYEIGMQGLLTAKGISGFMGIWACYVDRDFHSELVRGFFVCIYFSFDGMYLILG